MSSAIDRLVPPIIDGESDSHEPKSCKTRGPIVTGRELMRDILLVVMWVAATDLLIYQIGTFLAWAVLFVASVLFFALTKRSLGHAAASLTVATLLICLALKLIWCGAWLQVACGLLLIVCYAMSLAGSPPFLPEVLAFFGNVFAGAVRRVGRFRIGSVSEAAGAVRPAVGLQFVLPSAVVLIFASVFVMANPNIATRVALRIRRLSEWCGELLVEFDFTEAMFWFASAWLMLGLLYPARRWLIPERPPRELSQVPARSDLYLACRNTLCSVIVLFAVYLVFEFSTLWFRTFPVDFFYSGYAHQGAFWLTVALGLATLVLSSVFRGTILSDPRLATLKRLAIIWSIQNFLLSAAVYNRLFIYVDFNGMTRMRIIGLLGITAVVVGFVLVVVKILNDKGFVWLVHRQLWVPALAIVVYAILPVDWIVNSYNARTVLAGDPKAVVQVIAQPTTASGMLPITSLVDSDDEVIRDGVRALLAVWAHELGVAEKSANDKVTSQSIRRSKTWRSSLGHSTPWVDLKSNFSRRDGNSETAWHNFQGAEFVLRQRLIGLRSKWTGFASSSVRRTEALNQFFQHAYQWY